MSAEKLDVSEEEIEIIDFQSDDRNSAQEQPPKPVPANIKWMLVALVIILLVGGGSLFGFSKKPHKATAVSLDGETEAVLPIDALERDPGNDLTQSVKDTVKNKKVRPLTVGPVTEQDKLKEQIESMNLQVDDITSRMKSLETQNHDLTRHVEQILQIAKAMPSKDDLANIRHDLENMMQKNSEELQKSISEKTKQVAKKTLRHNKKRSYKRYKLPFKLVSIDQWDGLDYAAIQANNIGSIENLRVGDIRFGWKVTRIDALNSMVEFKQIKTGRTIKQTAI